jgi:hypothetical protein
MPSVNVDAPIASLPSSSPSLHQLLPISLSNIIKASITNISKLKFNIDRDDYTSTAISPITGDQVAALQHVQDRLPTDLKYLALLLKGFRQAYETAAPPYKTPDKVRN